MKQLTMTTLVLLALINSGANAAGAESRLGEHEGTRAAMIFGNGITGALIAGPVGYVFGAVTGAWLSEKVIDGYELAGAQSALIAEQADNEQLRAQLVAVAHEKDELQQFAAESLQFQVLFHTGNSQLEVDSEQRVAQLAQFLARQPQLHVMLSGHADPRGGEDYNDTLSIDRIASVTEVLASFGVSTDRISSTAYGEKQSLATKDDYDSYAFERRVDIQLLLVDGASGLAALR